MKLEISRQIQIPYPKDQLSNNRYTFLFTTKLNYFIYIFKDSEGVYIYSVDENKFTKINKKISNQLKVSPDENYLVSKNQIIDLKSSKIIEQISEKRYYNIYFGNSKYQFIGSHQNDIIFELFNDPYSERVKKIALPFETIQYLSFNYSEQEQYLWLEYQKQFIYLFNLQNEKQRKLTKPYWNQFIIGQYFVSNYDQKIKIYQLRNEKLIVSVFYPIYFCSGQTITQKQNTLKLFGYEGSKWGHLNLFIQSILPLQNNNTKYIIEDCNEVYILKDSSLLNVKTNNHLITIYQQQ